MMKRTVRLVLTYAFFGAVGGVALLWLGASVYFLIAGRDIAPPDLSAYQLPPCPKLQPEEDAYTYIKAYADYTDNVPSNLNWKVANAYIVGTTNRADCVECVRGILAAESNVFRCVKGIIASRGITVPSSNVNVFLADVCICSRMARQSCRLKAVYEATNGNLAAGRATLLEMFRLGSRMVELDDGTGSLQLIGEIVKSIAMTEMGKPLFAPDGDVAWLEKQQNMAAGLSVGDVERAKRSARYLMAWAAKDLGKNWFLLLDSEIPNFRNVVAMKLNNWIPGYAKYAFQENRTIAALKDQAERFMSKIGAPYDVEYAREFNFGHYTIPAPSEPVNPLSRNWLGRKWMKKDDFSGSYRMLFGRRFVARSLETALACRRYRAKHGRYPETLDDLVPEFIAAVPLDPYDGKPLRYNNEHHYVWTVGEELAFKGEVDFTSDGKPMWTSTRRKNYQYVRFLSPEGVSDACAGRPAPTTIESVRR